MILLAQEEKILLAREEEILLSQEARALAHEEDPLRLRRPGKTFCDVSSNIAPPMRRAAGKIQRISQRGDKQGRSAEEKTRQEQQGRTAEEQSSG